MSVSGRTPGTPDAGADLSCGNGVTFSFNGGAPQAAPPEATFPGRNHIRHDAGDGASLRALWPYGGIHSAAVSDGTRICCMPKIGPP